MKQQTDATSRANTIAAEVTSLRVTPARIDEVVVSEAYHVFDGSTVTVCLLTLRNGAKAIGHNYGAIDPTQQNWEEGKRVARAMAVEKVWELEGYALRQRLNP